MDLISITGARRSLAKLRSDYDCDYNEIIDKCINAISRLPIKEERKTGKWIYHIDDLFPAESTKECDQCRTHQDLNCDENFCPFCGAKMEIDE